MIIDLFKKLLGKNLFIVSVAVLLNSCGTENSSVTSDEKDTTSVVEDENGKNIFYSIPSPIELGQLMQRAGVTYNKQLLHSPDHVSKYSTTSSKALNLGVYGADLSYTTISDQAQESMLYLNAAKKLAEELGITNAFSQETMKQMEANKGNMDSLLQIISESYFASNEALKENERSQISELIIAGGWIEVLYIGTQVAKTTKDNTKIINLIAEQRGSLNNLISLLETKNGDEDITAVLNELKGIKEVYDETPSNTSKAEVTTDPNTNVITIGGASQYTLTKEQFEKITKKAESLRTQIIN